jgi:hypothetical protein
VAVTGQPEPDQQPVACAGIGTGGRLGEAGFIRSVLRAEVDAEGRDAVGNPQRRQRLVPNEGHPLLSTGRN